VVAEQQVMLSETEVLEALEVEHLVVVGVVVVQQALFVEQVVLEEMDLF
jgi:hypothetical protein